MKLLLNIILIFFIQKTILSQSTSPTLIRGTYIMDTGKKKYLIKLKSSDSHGKCKWKRKDAGYIVIQNGKWNLSNDTLTIKFRAGTIKETNYIYRDNTLTGIRNDKSVYNKQTL